MRPLRGAHKVLGVLRVSTKSMLSKIITAIDSFKGCLSSSEANQAAAEGIRRCMPDAEIIQFPVSDGGEGWTEAFKYAIGGEMVEAEVSDPLMRPIVAPYLIKGDTAVIEIAKASGLTLLSEKERNPMTATSYGTGQLVADAVRRGCRHIIVGLGGSATSDCGKGMLEAMHNAHDIMLKDVRFTIATDVKNPLCGNNGAAHVFAPQKGATPEMVEELDRRAKAFAEESARLFGYDRQDKPGAGAAGGLGYAFMQYLGAECRSGIELLLDTIFDDNENDRSATQGDACQSKNDNQNAFAGASLVITGEGSADSQTLMGKLPMGILQRARLHDIPVVLIAGRIKNRRQLLDAGFARVECINPPDLSAEEAMKPERAKYNISATTAEIISGYSGLAPH